MKKLLISCTYFYPNISGLSVYAKILAEKFGATVLTSRFEKSLVKIENIGGAKIVRSEVGLKIGKGVMMWNIAFDGWREINKVDVVNLHLPQLESWILATEAKVLKKKLIVTHHCEFSMSGGWGNIIAGLISFPFHLISYLLADQIVAYTEDYAQHSIFLRIFRNKIRYVLPPVNVGNEDKDKIKKLRARLGKGKIVGYVGRVAWEKGLEYLIESMRYLKDCKLVLVGPYNNVIGDNTFKKLKKLIGDNNVILLGPMEHEALVNFYKVCDCLVLPSINNLETYGIVQAEAMVYGVPVVASDLPGVRVPVKLTGMGKIAKVADSVDLAAKIKEVLMMKKSRAQITEARRIFDINLFGQAYRQLFFGK